jgi:acid stress-induced BolA-like protein IbaG/YrbA
MNLLAKFIIYPQLISDDIPKLGLISVEILPVSTLLVVVEWKTGFVPPRVEALIQTKTIAGVINKVSILTDRRAIDTNVACLSALFTGHSGIDHFEIIKAQVSSFFIRRSILAVSLSTSSSSRTLWVRDRVRSSSQL